jgi:hypothetical protein
LQVNGACPAINPVEFRLRNVSPQDVEVRSVSTTDPHFVVKLEGLPRPVKPDERIDLAVFFSSEVSGEFVAELVINTDAGCQSFRLKALVVTPDEGAAVSRDPYRMDFGRVQVGTASSERKVVIVSQPGNYQPAPTVAGFSVNDDKFEIVTQPNTTESNGCRTTELGLRFRAPAAAGLSTGALIWSMSSGDFDAVVLMELLGTAY